MSDYVVFTDGGCLGNPGVGAWAFVIYENNSLLFENSGSSGLTTNNIMELTAVINALTYIQSGKQNYAEDNIVLFTDSDYVKRGISEWIPSWEKNGWRKSDGKPVKNRELWVKLDSLSESMKISWCHVSAHSGVEGNEKCDAMVKKAMQEHNEPGTLF